MGRTVDYLANKEILPNKEFDLFHSQSSIKAVNDEAYLVKKEQ